jgi:uncharacterized membrane protein
MIPIRRKRFVLNCGSCKANICWIWKTKGKVKLHQTVSLTADGAVSGGFCGSLTGLIFLNAAAAAVSGALADIGINDRFMKELSATLIAGSSSPFLSGILLSLLDGTPIK